MRPHFAGATEIVRVRLLGGFRVSVGSRTVEEDAWRARKAAGLLKLLALAPSHWLQRERVMRLLWPDFPPKAASNNLRQTLRVARRALHPDPAISAGYLALRKEQLALCPGGQLWVDVEAFEEAAEAARREREPTAHRAALDLYAGELLPEDRYEEWAEGPRTRLRETYLALLIELARQYEVRGDFGSAARELRRVLAEEPAHETAHAALMRLYALSGRRGEALRQYERLRETLARALQMEPDASVRALREEITAGRLPALDAPVDRAEGLPRHNMPAPRSSLVGRQRELVEVKRDLAMTRLLTLTGAGGSGKTRLAIEAATELARAYPDGAWLAELASLSEHHLVPQEVAGALGVPEKPGRPLLDTLAGALFDKELLLVLDNCEHLLDACARLSDALLDACPRVRILATSREPLGVGGEAVRTVPPLPLPDAGMSTDAEKLARSGAVRLFIEGARLRLPAFEITPDNANGVADTCRRLGGLPLAIELAAGQMGALAAYQVAQRLEDSLVLLEGGPRTVAPRQRTMRASLDWSYEALDETERELFVRLSVFAGGWALEAAETVGAWGGMGEGGVLRVLSRLVNKSLVDAEATEDGSLRYRMLEPVRQYGREKLEESGESESAWRRHALFFLSFAEEAESQLGGPRQREWLERLERDHDNFRAALRWALERDRTGLAMRLAGALGTFWPMRGHLDEGRRWLEAALAETEGQPAARIKALARVAWIAWEQLDYERSSAFSEECLRLARRSGDEMAAAISLVYLGIVAMSRIELGRARELFEEAAMLQRGLGDRAGLARSLQALGLVAVAQHAYERAATLHEESLALDRETGNDFGIVLSLGQGALTAVGTSDYEGARVRCAEGLEISQRAGNLRGIVFHLHILAVSSSAQGRPVRSARLWGAADAISESLGITLQPVERYHYGPYIDAARARLDETSWTAAWEEGRAMTAERAIEYALSEEKPTPPIARPTRQSTGEQAGKLTPREEEVVVLIVRGLTNRQISQVLSISERTVDAHVRKILKKLVLRSRAQVAIWATEHQLASSDPS